LLYNSNSLCVGVVVSCVLERLIGVRGVWL